MSFSDFTEIKILDALLNQTNWTAPTAIYLSLHTASLVDAGTGTEVSGGSYARQAITTQFNAASGTSGALSNTGNITFTTATGSWGTVTDAGIWDAASSGNNLMAGALSASKTVGSGDTFQVDTGNLTVTVD